MTLEILAQTQRIDDVSEPSTFYTPQHNQMEMSERVDVSPEVAWIGAFVAGVVAIAAAAIAFPVRVYRAFIWQYFWGPVHADADGVECYVHLPDEGRTVEGSGPECSTAAYDVTAYIAEPGYTVVSTISYILVLVFMLAGVFLLLQRMDLTPYDKLFYALVPFMLFGGALRTVEDAFVQAIRVGETPALEFPASALLISPFIYFVVFAIALAMFLLAKYLASQGITDTWTYPLAATGFGWLGITVGYLFWLAVTTAYVTFEATILFVILGLATVGSLAAYWLAERFRPSINEATGFVGLIVVWGHAVDGFANVLANDWTHLWDLGRSYDPKHPFNEFVMDTTSTLQGSGLTEAVGSAWPFAIIKIIVPLAIVALFDRQFIDESPRFAYLLLAAILAVGLGPGTRDMLRFAFGI